MNIQKSHASGLGLLVALALAASLTACTSEPSEADIKAAAQTLVTKRDAVFNSEMAYFDVKKTGLPARTTTINSVRKIGCAAATGEPGFKCDLELSMTVKGANGDETPFKEERQSRLYQDKDTWVLTQ